MPMVDLEVGYAYKDAPDLDLERAIIDLLKTRGFSFKQHTDYDCWDPEQGRNARVMQFLKRVEGTGA